MKHRVPKHRLRPERDALGVFVAFTVAAIAARIATDWQRITDRAREISQTWRTSAVPRWQTRAEIVRGVQAIPYVPGLAITPAGTAPASVPADPAPTKPLSRAELAAYADGVGPAPSYGTGDPVVWTAAPDCGCAVRHARGLASFCRLSQPDYAEVYTCRGSVIVCLADLRPAGSSDLWPLAPAAAPVSELDLVQGMCPHTATRRGRCAACGAVQLDEAGDRR
ncbi:hypothetical protein ACWESM_18765 [Nocardia sp. NPDC003999]